MNNDDNTATYYNLLLTVLGIDIMLFFQMKAFNYNTYT